MQKLKKGELVDSIKAWLENSIKANLIIVII